MCNHEGVETNATSLGDAESDTIRALLHDLRQPLAAILLLSASPNGDVEQKLSKIRDEASWLAELVESSLDDAAGDTVILVDAREVADLVARRAGAAVSTDITVSSGGPVWAVARRVALARALACVVDNAVRAAGPDGHVRITACDCGIAVHLTVLDDGPGLGHVAERTSLGLITTRAMVAACEGAFRLAAGRDGGAEADISLPSGRSLMAAS
jgi:K+-sensing histidine kinase KdpD